MVGTMALACSSSTGPEVPSGTTTNCCAATDDTDGGIAADLPELDVACLVKAGDGTLLNQHITLDICDGTETQLAEKIL